MKTPAPKPLRKQLDDFIHKTSTEIAVAIMILVSVALILVEAAMADMTTFAAHTVMFVNDLITMVFVVELSVRYYVENKKSRFFRRYWVDIISVLPLLRAFRVLRVLRLLRLFRVGIILGKHLRVFSTSFRFIKIEYVIISIAIVITVLMGALSIRVAEGGNADFSSIENALWFSAMTLVAGEPLGGEAQTRLGRVITLTLMMGGLTIFAIFAGTVSAVMVESLRNMKFRHMDIDEIEGHAVICGWNRATELVVEEMLHDRRFDYIVVVSESEEIEDHPLFVQYQATLFGVVGDYTRVHVLKEAGIERAEVALLLADDAKEERSSQDRDARTVLAALLIEKLNQDIFTTVQLLNRDNETSLRRAGVEEIIVTDEYVGNIMASVVRSRGIVSMLDELLSARYGHQFFKHVCPDYLAGKTVAESMRILKEEHDSTLLAVSVDPEGRDLRVNPPNDFIIEAEHRIIIAASKPLDAVEQPGQ